MARRQRTTTRAASPPRRSSRARTYTRCCHGETQPPHLRLLRHARRLGGRRRGFPLRPCPPRGRRRPTARPRAPHPLGGDPVRPPPRRVSPVPRGAGREPADLDGRARLPPP